MHRSPRPVAALTHRFQVGHGYAPVVGLPVALTVTAHLDDEPLGQGVDHTDAYAVQTARDLVALPAELAAGVELGHDDLDGRAVVLFGHDSNGDTPAVVDDAHGRIGADSDVDAGAVAGQSLVYRVVDHLIDEMVQASVPGRPDVHARPLANGLQTFQYLDVTCVV